MGPDPGFMRRRPVGVEHGQDPLRLDRQPAVGERGKGRGQLERRDVPGAQRQGGHVGLVAQAEVVRDAQHVTRPHLLLKGHRRLVVRLVQGLAQRLEVRRLSAGVAGSPLVAARGRDPAQVGEHGNGREAALQRSRVHDRLEGGSRLAWCSPRGEGRGVKSRPPPGPGCRPCAVEGHSAPCRSGMPSLRSPRRARAPPPPGWRATTGVCALASPGVVAAEAVAELLAQELLRVPERGVGQPGWR